MSTKSSFDIQTLPWILSNALPNLKAKQNIVIMNDFIDGATTYAAYQLSKARFANQTEVTAVVVPDVSLSKAPAFEETQTAEQVFEEIQTAKQVFEETQTVEQVAELKANEEHVLAGQKAQEALLQSITAANQNVLAEKADVSEEDKEVQAVLEATQKEAEDVRKKQEEVVQLIQKRLASLKPSQQ